MTEADAEALASDVSRAVALLEGEAGVHDVIRAVARMEPVAVRKISRATELPVPIVAAVCGELRKCGVIAKERPVRLTPAGRSLFGFDSAAASRDAGLTAGRADDDRLSELDKVGERLTRIAAAAPAPRVEVDQMHCTVATKLRRVLFMNDSGALVNRRVLLLGDDDLISVTMHHFAQHCDLGAWLKELVVVDIDTAVLEYSRAQLVNAGFPVTFVQHDLRQPLPRDLTDRADTIFTDPPYTQEAAELFLSRAASALAPGTGRHVFMSFGMKSPQVSLIVQTAITTMGFVVRQLIRNFNEYLGAGALAGSSHLYHLASTNATAPTINGPHSGRLYTGDRSPARRYKCTACGAVEEVGANQRFRTIGQLKLRRCVACGGSTFRPLPRVAHS